MLKKKMQSDNLYATETSKANAKIISMIEEAK